MMTFAEQLHEHIAFLRGHGLDVQSLEFGRLIRCHAINKTGGRGELAYSCHQNEMQNGYIGLVTWCRGVNGEDTLKSYSLPPSENDCIFQVFSSTTVKEEDLTQKHEESARRAYGFWEHSSFSGTSDYLIHKGVGYHGIRFRSNEYGNVAVVPMRDEKGKLWSYQLLNPNGSKRIPKGARTKGLFHKLQELVDGHPIGIAESYVTAATCYQLTEISMVCAFSATNLSSIALSLRKFYPQSLILLFADNDRHLEAKGLGNEGVKRVIEAADLLKSHFCVAVPDFGHINPTKDASDWNDLYRLCGAQEAKGQILAAFQLATTN